VYTSVNRLSTFRWYNVEYFVLPRLNDQHKCTKLEDYSGLSKVAGHRRPTFFFKQLKNKFLTTPNDFMLRSMGGNLPQIPSLLSFIQVKQN
jgi:hypothetical protein